MPGYRTFNQYITSVFPGGVRKIAVNAGLGCPSRCTYCNNASFSPDYAKGDIRAQIEKGKSFFSRKGTPAGYLAYFQSFTGTYGPTEKLIELYEEALSCPDVLGLVIATRPDCLADDLLDYFRRRFGNDAPEGHPYMLVEIGVETTNEETLQAIRRGHDWECSRNAILRLNDAGIDVGAHLILGLPGETEDDFINHADRLSELPIKTLKLHQLQIIRGTAMAAEYTAHPENFDLMTPQRYVNIIVKMLKHLREDIALDRFVSEAPSEMVLAPSWGLKPQEFSALLEKCKI